jgi:hypothetical protein
LSNIFSKVSGGLGSLFNRSWLMLCNNLQPLQHQRISHELAEGCFEQ